MIKLSIVIPVYNVEKYIAKCLESCLEQNSLQDEYEIIVVNDGTPDNSMSVVEEYSRKYKNIHIINQNNGGLSAARNTGLEHAQGEYIWFVDSDDWIERYSIDSLLSFAIKNQLDILCFGLQLVYEDGRTEKYHIQYEQDGCIYRGSEFICKVGMPPAAWAAFYRREYLMKNKLRFMTGILHEDQEFTPRAYYLAPKIAFVDKVIYNYYQRTGSIMKSNRSAKKCKDLLTVADSLYDFLMTHIAKGSPGYASFIDKVNFAFSQSLAHYSKEAFALSEYKKRKYYPLSSDNGLALKYRIANFSLRFYIFLIRVKNQ